jgi:hypothetical protein
MVIRVLKNKWGFCPSHYITIVPPQSYVTSVIGWLPFLFSSRQPRPPLDQLRAHVLLFAVSHFFTQYGSDSRVYLSDKVAPGVSVWRACPSSLLKNRKAVSPLLWFFGTDRTRCPPHICQASLWEGASPHSFPRSRKGSSPLTASFSLPRHPYHLPKSNLYTLHTVCDSILVY